METAKLITIVIPAHNEQTNIRTLYEAICDASNRTSHQIDIVVIDDGSSDNTLNEVKKIKGKLNIFYIQLSRNFGHQHALKAGLDHAKGDCVISMDADLQHPPEIIIDLIKKWEEGYDVVYTIRKENQNESWFKRKTSNLFYSIHNLLSDVKLDPGTADFRLMSRAVVNAFSQFKENEIFIRGLVKWAGFKQAAIEYTPNERFSGDTKYTLTKMLSFAFKGITSFSTKPLKLVVYFSLALFLLSTLLIPYTVISYIMGVAVSGWTSLMITVILFGSLQLVLIGIIGLYISKLVIQTKQRPLYFIKDSNYPDIKSK